MLKRLCSQRPFLASNQSAASFVGTRQQSTLTKTVVEPRDWLERLAEKVAVDETFPARLTGSDADRKRTQRAGEGARKCSRVDDLMTRQRGSEKRVQKRGVDAAPEKLWADKLGVDTCESTSRWPGKYPNIAYCRSQKLVLGHFWDKIGTFLGHTFFAEVAH